MKRTANIAYFSKCWFSFNATALLVVFFFPTGKKCLKPPWQTCCEIHSMLTTVQCVLNTLQPSFKSHQTTKTESSFSLLFLFCALHSRDNHVHVRNPISYFHSTLVCFQLDHYNRQCVSLSLSVWTAFRIESIAWPQSVWYVSVSCSPSTHTV